MDPTTSSPPYMEDFPRMEDATFLSTTNFDLGWLQDLYNQASKSLDQIYGDFDSFSLNPDDILDLGDFDTNDYVEDSKGPVIYMSVWAVVALAFTLVGIIWCLCCNKCLCCCRSSFRGKSSSDLELLEGTDPNFPVRPYYSERNKKYTKSSPVAIILLLLMGFGLLSLLLVILFTFAANVKTNEAVDGVDQDLDNALKDANTYIGVSINQLNHLLDRGFGKLSETVTEIAENCDTGVECGVIKQRIGEAVGRAKEEVQTSSELLRDALNTVQKEMNNTEDTLDGDYQDVVNDVNNGMYWLFMLFNILYCVVFGLTLVGTVLAAAGKSSGMKTGGYLMIRGAMVLMFTLIIFVVAQLIVMFVFGGVLTEILCPALRDLEETGGQDGSVAAAAGVNESPGREYEIPSYAQIMKSCKNDESAYKSFNLKTAFPIEDLRDVSHYFDIIPITGQSGVLSTTSNITKNLPGIKADWQETVNEVKGEVNQYIEFVINTVETEVGKCKPAYEAVNATITIFCHKLPAPFISFWWILQFIPAIFLLMIITTMFFERIHF